MQTEELRKLYPFLFLLAIYVSAYVIAIPLALKIVALGPLVIPGGYLAASFTYPCTDIASEVYGEKYARALVSAGLIAILVMLILVQIDIFLPAAEFWKYEQSYNDVFGFSLRITIAGLIAFILGQYLDVYFFARIRKLTKGKHLWFRNNLSTAMSKLIDAFSFNFIGFLGIYQFSEVFYMSISAYIFYLLIALLDTPFVYLGVWWTKKYIESEHKAFDQRRVLVPELHFSKNI